MTGGAPLKKRNSAPPAVTLLRISIGGMDVELFLSLLLNGLSMGVIYALIAMGLIMLIRAVNMLNFAQGDMLTIGAYVGCTLYVNMALPLWAAMVVSLLIFAVFALIFMFSIYWPLRNSNIGISRMIATMGASVVIKEVLLKIFGEEPMTMPYFLRDAGGHGAMLKIFGVSIQLQYIIVIVIGLLCMAGIFLLFEKLYAGKMMQAASQDKRTAELIGIPTTITIAATYILSVSIAAFGGLMIAPIFAATVTLNSLQFGAFAGAVIGGWGNIKGAIIGAIIVGLVQSFSVPIFDLYKDAAVFLLMVLFLVFRPKGMFRSKIGDKA